MPDVQTKFEEMSDHPPSITVTLGSINLTLDEVTALMSHKKNWLKSQGLASNEDNAEKYLKLALLTFVKQHQIK